MAYINTEWLPDTLAQFISTKEVLDKILAQLDDEIAFRCLVCGVAKASIPVDQDGYVTSEILKLFGVAKICELIMLSYDDIGGDDDVYSSKYAEYKERAKEFLSGITKNSILGLVDEDGNILPNTTNNMIVGRFSPTNLWGDD